MADLILNAAVQRGYNINDNNIEQNVLARVIDTEYSFGKLYGPIDKNDSIYYLSISFRRNTGGEFNNPQAREAVLNFLSDNGVRWIKVRDCTNIYVCLTLLSEIEATASRNQLNDAYLANPAQFHLNPGNLLTAHLMQAVIYHQPLENVD